MRRSGIRSLRTLLAIAILLGAIVQPALIRCVDASGHGSIELPGADCCDHAQHTNASTPLSLDDEDCEDETLSAPAIRPAGDSDALASAHAAQVAHASPTFALQAPPTMAAMPPIQRRFAYLGPPPHLTVQLNC